MTISVNFVEALWILLNLVTFLLTAFAFLDARADQETVRLLNGRARELAAAGLVRREGLRVAVQALLLFVALPGLFVDREVVLSPAVAALMVVPAILLTSSLFDGRDRKRMALIATADILEERTSSLERIEAKLDANTKISREASEHADKAYHEANSVNEKIAAQGAVMVKEQEAGQADRTRIEGTVDDTHERVVDIQDRTKRRP